MYDSPIDYLEVINGICLQVNPLVTEVDKTYVLGSKGKKRYFMRPDWSVIVSNDVWTVGIVPDRFKDLFPNTLIEITYKAYKKLEINNKKCRSRACFDRYECFRFDRSLEQQHGAFNSIPKTWKRGAEKCGAFIGFNEINITKL